MTYSLSSFCIGLVALVSLSSPAMAQSVAEKGTITCEQSDLNQLPGSPDQKKVILVSNTVCSFVDQDPSFKTDFSTMIELDPATATGRTISSTGRVLSGDKVSSVFTIKDGDWHFQMKDNQMVGWTSEGSTLFNGGEFAGRSMNWQGKATGPNTFVLDYQVQ